MILALEILFLLCLLGGGQVMNVIALPKLQYRITCRVHFPTFVLKYFMGTGNIQWILTSEKFLFVRREELQRNSCFSGGREGGRAVPCSQH